MLDPPMTRDPSGRPVILPGTGTTVPPSQPRSLLRILRCLIFGHWWEVLDLSLTGNLHCRCMRCGKPTILQPGEAP